MTEAKPKYHGGRALLNLPGHQSTAAIVAEIRNTAIGEPDNTWASYPTYIFQISNCDRSISFELDWLSHEDRENSLHKVDTMISVLKSFRRGLKLEQGRYVRAQNA